MSAIAAPPKQTGRESEQSLGPHGRARIVQGWTEAGEREVIAVQQQVFVGIDVSKVQLEVALSTGEGLASSMIKVRKPVFDLSDSVSAF